MLFVVLCPGTPEGSAGSDSGFKASQKMGQRLKVSSNRHGEARNRTCDPWFTRHRFIPYTTFKGNLTLKQFPVPVEYQHLFFSTTSLFFVKCLLTYDYSSKKGAWFWVVKSDEIYQIPLMWTHDGQLLLCV